MRFQNRVLIGMASAFALAATAAAGIGRPPSRWPTMIATTTS